MDCKAVTPVEVSLRISRVKTCTNHIPLWTMDWEWLRDLVLWYAICRHDNLMSYDLHWFAILSSCWACFLRSCGCTPSFEARMAITSETRAKVLWNSANSALEQAWTVKKMWNKDCLKKAWSCTGIIFSPANMWIGLSVSHCRQPRISGSVCGSTLGP